MQVCFDVGHVLCCQGQGDCLAAQTLRDGVWGLIGIAASNYSLLARGFPDAVWLAIDFCLPGVTSRFRHARREDPHQLVHLGLLHFRDDAEQCGIVVDLWSPTGWQLAEQGLARQRKALLISRFGVGMWIGRDDAQEQVVDEPVLRPLLLLGAAQARQ